MSWVNANIILVDHPLLAPEGQRARISVPRPAVMKSAVASALTSAVCHTPGGFTTA